jgi:REP element-mobilizing transposase RayT
MKERSPYDVVGRRALPHDPPHFIGTSDATFFVTLCCRERGFNQLCKPEIAKSLFEAVLFYENRGDWYVHLLLLMPDHAHFLVRFSHAGLKKIVGSWKRYVATQAGVIWQRDFFDHRLRSDESFTEKASYIRLNPVRAGLIDTAGKWPYVFFHR